MKANEFVDKYLKVGDSIEEPSKVLWWILSEELQRIKTTMTESLEQWLADNFDFSIEDYKSAGSILHFMMAIQIGRKIQEDKVDEVLDEMFKEFKDFVLVYEPLFRNE